MLSTMRLLARTYAFVLCFSPALVLSIGARAETVQIPSPYGTMVADIFRPAGPGPSPVVIFSHGRGTTSERASMRHPLREQYATYWTQKGFTLVAPMRPGYGATGGSDPESSGSDAACSSVPNFNRTASSAAAAILATVDWVRQQPWAKPNKILLVGQSVGGLGTVAAAAQNPQGVVGYINFAGGSGGNPRRSPGKSCHPEELTDIYGSLGSSVRLPGLWFYASNDLYWGPDMPKLWGQAFNAHGGHATLIFTGPSGDNGHHLFAESPGLWQTKVASFMRERGL
jgi:dienelactone hydrolase